MLSLDLIRRETERVRQALLSRGEEAPLGNLLVLDARRRQIVEMVDNLRANRNQVSKEMGLAKQRPPHLIDEMRRVGAQIKEFDQELRSIEEELKREQLMLPNLPQEDVPPGKDVSGNLVLRTWGEPQTLPSWARPHWDLGMTLGILDEARGSKISGSRFFVLRGAGALISRALVAWMLDLHTNDHGYTEIAPPYLVKRETLVNSGHLPKFIDNQYWDTEDDLWLIPTAETSLTGLHSDEVLDASVLPLNYVAYSPCFRREKASAGKDTRGIKRVKQFDKVELYKIVEPATSARELERLVDDAEEVLRRLGLAYRVVELCAGELGFASAKTYDLEVWAGGSMEWLEVSSCSNCADFQARRAKIRYRRIKRATPQYVHTLNGSGLAIPRVLIAILENYQQTDGSVVVPEVLRSYTGTDVIRPL